MSLIVARMSVRMPQPVISCQSKIHKASPCGQILHASPVGNEAVLTDLLKISNDKLTFQNAVFKFRWKRKTLQNLPRKRYNIVAAYHFCQKTGHLEVVCRRKRRASDLYP